MLFLAKKRGARVGRSSVSETWDNHCDVPKNGESGVSTGFCHDPDEVPWC